MEQIKRLASDAPAHLVGGFERLVRESPPQRLELQLMHSAARRPVLDGIFWQMPKQVDESAARPRAVRETGSTTSIRWVVTGRADGGTDVYHLVVEDGRARTERGEGPDRAADGDARRRRVPPELASGNSDPMQAYFSGRIQLSGDIMVAAKMAQMFGMTGGMGGGGNGTPPAGPDGGR